MFRIRKKLNEASEKLKILNGYKRELEEHTELVKQEADATYVKNLHFCREKKEAFETELNEIQEDYKKLTEKTENEPETLQQLFDKCERIKELEEMKINTRPEKSMVGPQKN